MTLTLWHIVGARPQFMKLGAVYRAAASKPNIKQFIIHTGQHYDPNLSGVFFPELDLPLPDYNLGIGGSSQSEQIGKSIIEITEVLNQQQPSCVVIYGDANSALSGTIACSYLKFTIAHVEAGARQRFKHTEETNRIVADHLADFRYACTKEDIENLHKEGLEKNSILAGDTMFDNWIFQMPRMDTDIINKLNLIPNEYVLVTCHRAEIVDDPRLLEEVLKALNTISKTGIKIVFPIHPRTRKRIYDFNLQKILNSEILTIDPLGFHQLQALTINCAYLITDSGGVCREAYFARKPAISPSQAPGWPQLSVLGWVTHTDTRETDIVQAALNIKAPNDTSPNVFGNGDAGKIIIDDLLKHLLSQ